MKRTKQVAGGQAQTVSSVIFGAWNRYRLDTFRTRFGDLMYFVVDAEKLDRTGMPTVIRQATTESQARSGLE